MEVQNLPGPLKLAILIKVLDQPTGDLLLSRLTPEQRKVVLGHVTQLGDIPIELAEKVVEELGTTLRALRGARATSALPPKTEEISKERLALLKSLKPYQLVSLLRSEHPQTIAIVLAHVPTDVAGEVLAGLPPELRVEVAFRIAQSERFIPARVEELERVLAQLLKERETVEIERFSGVDRLAEMLNMMESRVADEIMRSIEEVQPELAAEIKQRMFTFEDLVHVDDRGMQRLLRRIETRELAMALKGASEEVKQKIFKNMSERAAEMIKEEMEALGAVRMKDVEEAQSSITRVVQEMEEKGELIISGRRGEQFVG